jgi:hypothetical protein
MRQSIQSIRVESMVARDLVTTQQGEVKGRPKTAYDFNNAHPLVGAFRAFCRNNPPTLRQARKFLQKFPTYRELAAA